jgi:hypothetical protein
MGHLPRLTSLVFLFFPFNLILNSLRLINLKYITNIILYKFEIN